MSRIDLLGRYPELNADEVSELIAQRNPHTDLNNQIHPYDGDKDWKTRIRDNWWAKDYTGEVPRGRKPILALRDSLLEFGGCEAVLPVVEPDIESLLSRGQLWDNTEIKFKEMAASRCHQNASLIWLKNKDKQDGKSLKILCTGYALSEDGFWRQHSWIIEVTNRGSKIIETTEPRVAYFGFGFTYEESEMFVEENVY